MMAKSRRRMPRYVTETSGQNQESAEAVARSRDAWVERCKTILNAAEQKRWIAQQKYWASVDPATRLRQVRPFDLSPQHGITHEVLCRFKEIKSVTLGYLECTIQTWDEDRCHLTEGRLGSVASQEDADRLMSALAAEFPHIPFRVELEDELLEYVIWQSVEEVQNAAPSVNSGTTPACDTSHP